MLVKNDAGCLQETLCIKGSKLKLELKAHVQELALGIGERNLRNPGSLLRTLSYIRNWWTSLGFEVHSQDYHTTDELFTNLWVEIEGSERPDEIVVLGAHYDTFLGTPGADDNGTAVAGLLSLSKILKGESPKRSIRFVAFANEEPPYFMSDFMGSYVYARHCQEQQDNIVVMVCLEMLGYFDDEPGSQKVTYDLLPSQGNFIALCGNEKSEQEVLRAGQAFRRATSLPLSLVAISDSVMAVVAYSDHWSFWQCGWPAFMVTDTGPLRNPHYHQESDLPHTLDYDSFAKTVLGVEAILRDFAGFPHHSISII